VNIATLRWYKGNFDHLQLIIKGEVPQIVVLKDRHITLELNRQLTIAHCEDHEDELDIEIDGNSYTFPLKVWHAILSVTDQWLGEYLKEESWLT